MGDSEKAIQVQDLHCYYGDVRAVHGVSFDVQAGEIFSLLGPNGAGKTTTISVISCILQPTQGDAFVLGHPVTREPMAVKAAIGVVPQEIALYEDLSARENLAFWGKMYGLRGRLLKERVDEVLEVIGLADRQKGRVSKFSGGMKRRLNIGIALLHRPQVLILDEPTVGIDPQSRRSILDSVKELNRQGTTVLYTTHYMEEAQELSDHIAIMDHGKLIAQGTHGELVKIVGEMDRIRLAISVESARVMERWQATKGVRQVNAIVKSIVAQSVDALAGSKIAAGVAYVQLAGRGARVDGTVLQSIAVQYGEWSASTEVGGRDAREIGLWTGGTVG